MGASRSEWWSCVRVCGRVRERVCERRERDESEQGERTIDGREWQGTNYACIVSRVDEMRDSARRAMASTHRELV